MKEVKSRERSELICPRMYLLTEWFWYQGNASLIEWVWKYSLLFTWCKALTHLKRPWCWERLRAGGEGDDRGWDGWMESLTRWTWVWVDSGSWLWTGRPGMLWFMGSQSIRHDWATELNWTLTFWNSLRRIGIKSSINVCYNSPVKSSVLDLCLWGGLLITGQCHY